MLAQLRFRQGTAEEWTEVNPVLAIGEPGYETDTNKFKIGDGLTHWVDLAYQGAVVVPTKLSDLTNDVGFVTATDIMIAAEGDPTTETVGKINQMYRNTLNNNIFMCVDITDGAEEIDPKTYTWIKIFPSVA